MAEIRPLTAADLPQLMHLSTAASWNQTSLDWLRLLALEPHGCFGIEVDGVLASTATVLRYPPNLAWLGMVLTRPDFRGRGLARELMNHSIEYARGGVIRLDASDMGKPLYDSLGFTEECRIERWLREPAPVDPSNPLEFEHDPSLDLEAFRADRSELIRALAQFEAASIPGTAFALGRPGRAAAYFGPCVSGSPEAVRSLLHWFVHRHADEPIFWDLFPHHLPAATLAAEFGFRPERQLTRISLNALRPALPDDRIYAIAGFEYG